MTAASSSAPAATKAFIVCDGKVLILRESSTYEDGTNVARYDLPGGRLTPGEQVFEALKREVREETGLDISIDKPLSVGEWRPKVRGEQWQVVGIFFECSTATPNVSLSEDHDAYEWITPSDFASFPLIDNLVPLFKEYSGL